MRGGGNQPFVASWEAKGEVRHGNGILLSVTDAGPLLEVKVCRDMDPCAMNVAASV